MSLENIGRHPLKSITSPVHRALGEAIKEARLRERLTQTDVAEKLEWPQNRISMIERGGRYVDVAELVELAWAIGPSAHEILKRATEIAGPSLSAQRHRLRKRPRKPPKAP